MFETVFRGEDLPPAERFDGWRQLVFASHAPTELRTDHADDFDATLRLLELGPVQVSVLTCPSLHSHRTPKLIRQSDPELYHLALAQRGSVAIEQADRQTVLGSGDLTLSTTSRPYLGRLAADQSEAPSGVTLVQALLPRALLPLPADAADRLLAADLPARQGLGALFAQFIARLATDTTRYGPTDASRLGGVALDLAASLVAHHFGADRELPPETHRQTLAVRVHAFIYRHLGDPRLAPDMIAAAHHISSRTLHRIFQSQGTTVSMFIREQRLERARRDLADPTLATRPINAIAIRWGFRRPADFTRAFRTAYGMPPREYRQLALYESSGAPR
ncbi:helix-turn-helix domain-containing protein [Streptomyces marispadix]|uniref:Helix-turn-helix domain-containing protein n=1 Tax=Streptomyces marispadix TaxID=2922868 RepID=A0ABS9SRH0_9ACTN|nr:helix-turn-helix domain-containing protein [Streptomyces marispadix]MCH6158880.1 helix-turn-helix domain-containing protein [Streptomyces marispadix]